MDRLLRWCRGGDALRRSAAVASLVSPAVIVAGLGYALVDRRYYPWLEVGDNLCLGVMTAGVVLALAGWLVRGPNLRIVFRLLGGIIASLSLVCGLLAVALAPLEPRFLGTLSVSGRFAVVGYHADFWDSSRLVLRVRTRHGVFSREGREDLACFSGVAPGWQVDRVRFVGRHTVEIRLDDGETARVSFDPDTLAPGVMLDRCSGAPYGDD